MCCVWQKWAKQAAAAPVFPAQTCRQAHTHSRGGLLKNQQRAHDERPGPEEEEDAHAVVLLLLLFELSRLSLLCTMLTVLLRQHGQFCAFLMPPLAHKGTAEGG